MSINQFKNILMATVLACSLASTFSCRQKTLEQPPRFDPTSPGDNGKPAPIPTVKPTAKPNKPTKPSTVFSPNFLWGVAVAGYQVEGGDTNSQWYAWEQAGKTRDRVGSGPDFYNRYMDDFTLAADDIGLNAFRTSIEWSRIEPRKGYYDPAAIQYYHEMLDGMISKGLTPLMTAYHFAYPMWLDSDWNNNNLVGWEDPATIKEFERYTAFIAKEFGSKIKYWITINEPNTYTLASYLLGVHPPGKRSLGAFNNVNAKLMEAHRKAYDAIHANDSDAMVSYNPFHFIGKGGPDLGKDQKTVSAASQQDIPKMLSPFTWLNQALGKGGLRTQGENADKLDYVSFDYYYPFDMGKLGDIPSPWTWEVYPDGFYQALMDYHRSYHLPILIAENGMSTRDGGKRTDNWDRSSFLVNHVAQMQKAIRSGVRLLGYFHWSLMDNYEWGSFEPRFGLYLVDYRSPDVTRIPTKAVEAYRDIIQANEVTPEILKKYPAPGKQMK